MSKKSFPGIVPETIPGRDYLVNIEVSNAIGLSHLPINPLNDRRMRQFGSVWQQARVTNVQTPLPRFSPIYIPANNFSMLIPFNKPTMNTRTPNATSTNKFSQLLTVFANALGTRNPQGETGIF